MKTKNFTFIQLVLLMAIACPSFSQSAQVTAVGCSEYRSFYLGSDKKVYASLWDNSVGASRATPYDFGGKSIVGLRAALYYGLALDADGYLWNLPNKSPIPTRISTDYLGKPFNNIVSFDGWYATNVAVKSDGTIWLWGGNDYSFSLLAALNPTPLNAPAGVKFKKVICGKTLVALTTDGQVYEWAKGNGKPTKQSLPGAATDVVSGGQGFVVAVVDGWPYGWGEQGGYVGLSGIVKKPTALKSVWGMSSPIVKITANYNAIHYIDANGDLWGMGDNAEGDVGNGEELVNHAEKYPTPYVWGWNPNGLMVTKPVHIAQGIKFKDIFAGSSYAFYHFAIDTKGNVYSWGRNKSNDLGNGITVNNESAYPNALDVLKPTLVTPMTTLSRGYDFAPYTINPGPAQTITLPTSSVKMAGSATPATGYTIASYKWTQVSGPSTANIKDPSSPTTEINGLVAGKYVFNLQMTDNNTATISGQVTITVLKGKSSSSQAVASVGGNQNITLPVNSVVLDGSNSTSQGSNITSYQWTKVSGPSAGTISSPTSAKATATGLVAGVYVFALTVKDANGNSATAQMTITVNAVTGTFAVNAGTDQAITLPTNNIVIAAASTITGGQVLSLCKWTQISGPSKATITNGGTLKPTFSGLVQGSYVFEVSLLSVLGLTVSDRVTVTVNAAPASKPSLTVNAGADQTLTLPVTAIVKGTVTAANNSVSSYKWTQVSGPATAHFVNAGVAQTEITGLVAGTYVFKVTVTGSTGLTASDEVTVTVKSNSVPTLAVNAGADQTVTLPVTAIVKGTATAANNSVSSYKWTQVSGPATAHFVNAGVAQTEITGLAAGTYVFKVTVTGSTGLTASDQVTLTVKPAAKPTLAVNAGADQTITLPGRATVAGTATATNSSVSSYQWTQVSGPATAYFVNSKVAQSEITSLVAGTYVFKLTATGSTGLTATDQLTLTVKPAPKPTLTVNAGADQTVTLPSRATVAGTATATNSSVAGYQWTQVSGPATAYFVNSKVAQSEITGLVAGTYVFKLTATGSTGLTATDQLTLTVKPVPVSLTVNAGADQTITWPSRADVAGGAVAINCSVTSYQWTEVSGPAVCYFINSKAAQTQAVGLVAGTYVFKLTVTGSTGLTATDQMTLTVKPGDPPTLTVNAGADQTVILPSRATVTGTGHSTNNAITGYQWTQVSGPAPAYFIDSKAAQSEIVGLVAGTYVFKLTATGSAGLTASDLITVTAKTPARALISEVLPSIPMDDSTDDVSRTVRLYPNPVMIDQQLAVEGQGWKAGTLKFSIYDLGGRMVKQVVLDNQFSSFRQTIPITGLTKGVYMLTIQAEGQKSQVLRFIVQ